MRRNRINNQSRGQREDYSLQGRFNSLSKSRERQPTLYQDLSTTRGVLGPNLLSVKHQSVIRQQKEPYSQLNKTYVNSNHPLTITSDVCRLRYGQFGGTQPSSTREASPYLYQQLKQINQPHADLQNKKVLINPVQRTVYAETLRIDSEPLSSMKNKFGISADPAQKKPIKASSEEGTRNEKNEIKETGEPELIKEAQNIGIGIDPKNQVMKKLSFDENNLQQLMKNRPNRLSLSRQSHLSAQNDQPGEGEVKKNFLEEFGPKTQLSINERLKLKQLVELKAENEDKYANFFDSLNEHFKKEDTSEVINEDLLGLPARLPHPQEAPEMVNFEAKPKNSAFENLDMDAIRASIELDFFNSKIQQTHSKPQTPKSSQNHHSKSQEISKTENEKKDEVSQKKSNKKHKNKEKSKKAPTIETKSKSKTIRQLKKLEKLKEIGRLMSPSAHKSTIDKITKAAKKAKKLNRKITNMNRNPKSSKSTSRSLKSKSRTMTPSPLVKRFRKVSPNIRQVGKKRSISRKNGKNRSPGRRRGGSNRRRKGALDSKTKLRRLKKQIGSRQPNFGNVKKRSRLEDCGLNLGMLTERYREKRNGGIPRVPNLPQTSIFGGKGNRSASLSPDMNSPAIYSNQSRGSRKMNDGLKPNQGELAICVDFSENQGNQNPSQQDSQGRHSISSKKDQKYQMGSCRDSPAASKDPKPEIRRVLSPEEKISSPAKRREHQMKFHAEENFREKTAQISLKNIGVQAKTSIATNGILVNDRSTQTPDYSQIEGLLKNENKKETPCLLNQPGGRLSFCPDPNLASNKTGGFSDKNLKIKIGDFGNPFINTKDNQQKTDGEKVEEIDEQSRVLAKIREINTLLIDGSFIELENLEKEILNLNKLNEEAGPLGSFVLSSTETEKPISQITKHDSATPLPKNQPKNGSSTSAISSALDNLLNSVSEMGSRLKETLFPTMRSISSKIGSTFKDQKKMIEDLQIRLVVQSEEQKQAEFRSKVDILEDLKLRLFERKSRQNHYKTSRISEKSYSKVDKDDIKEWIITELVSELRSEIWASTNFERNNSHSRYSRGFSSHTDTDKENNINASNLKKTQKFKSCQNQKRDKSATKTNPADKAQPQETKFNSTQSHLELRSQMVDLMDENSKLAHLLEIMQEKYAIQKQESKERLMQKVTEIKRLIILTENLKTEKMSLSQKLVELKDNINNISSMKHRLEIDLKSKKELEDELLIFKNGYERLRNERQAFQIELNGSKNEARTFKLEV